MEIRAGGIRFCFAVLLCQFAALMVSAETFHLSTGSAVEGKLLKVSGERNANDDTTMRHMSEIGYGRFERRFALPDTVASDKVTATFEYGMLELTLPTSESAKPRRIEIESVAPAVLAEIK